ncbi:fatty acyl-CoA reductase 1-like [Dermatophagoides pteronyssinus]|uniref:Fatty acyl-CoA reductase n=1 Tax=Dermatophagoides pteronyssinus TaxID=6956 RepID=A0A6P6YBC1_DERPT|nr:fatty acyl-CoA reductase 2-like [Dermatophagoides pteronyssinus]
MFHYETLIETPPCSTDLSSSPLRCNNDDNNQTRLDFTYLQELLLSQKQQNQQQASNNDKIITKSSTLLSNRHEFDIKYLNIIDFYRNKTILITGATGFIGKVLLEKFLRIGVLDRIYVLLRSKHNKTPYERLQELLNQSPCFQFNRQQLNFDKVFAIDGDITQKDLGLSFEDHRLLIQQVNIVIHSAASVQFKGNLRIFIEQNVFGTDNIMRLCTEMINLKSVVYVSTAYSNCNLSMIEEKIYPINYTIPYAYVNDNIDEFIDDIMWKYGNIWPKSGHQALWGRPNCYTFSKALAELLLVKKYGNKLPYVICRPSIVTHSVAEPTFGWCDTKNGVSGAMILGGLGIARTMILNGKCNADVIPVDYVVNGLIVVAAHTAIVPVEQRKQVVHLTSGERNPITWGELLNRSRECVATKPFLKQIRPLAKKPETINTYYGRLSHQMTKIFSHYCFALVADGLAMITGNKPFLLNITKRMHLGFDTLEPFTNNEWQFRSQNYLDIFYQLSPHEQEIFRSDIGQIDWMKYVDNATLGTRRYLLKEDDSTIDQAIQRQKFINWAYGSGEALAYLGIFGTIWWQIFSEHIEQM